MKLYVAGPMSGLPNHNYPAFKQTTKWLRSHGHEVLCPTEINPPSDENISWTMCMERDIAEAVSCEGIVLLRDWSASKGATLEVLIFAVLDKSFWTINTLSPEPVEADRLLREPMSIFSACTTLMRAHSVRLFSYEK